MVTALATGAGAVLVLLALRDVFHALLHPSGRGRISPVVSGLVWRACRRLGGRATGLGGPAVMVAVAVVWLGLVVTGWALVYWPHLDSGFSYGIGLEPARRDDLVDAFYVSTVTLTTLGFGDVVPTAGWLRLAAPVEGMIGFGLLTAGVSWILQVYPALGRRRAAALQLDGLRRTRTAQLLRQEEPEGIGAGAGAPILRGLAAELDQVRVDLLQYEVTYYFADPEPSSSLATLAPYALELSAAARESGAASLRHAGAVLDVALGGLAEALDSRHLHTGGSTSSVLAAYERAQCGG
ncbi:potassium channel family protein [Myceligenerans salitolerans]|uniref:Two pore domain potassium channel family protein n=1 Tax=Myceligenerans salitolerans TaxID=1230528 RepID=A0ABS3ID30_9MICO|nr:potassium channel family protein [Myceligenerans salitolerans]MBO0610333.1 two pore domain potassium channel family protein [Myceligenerans salitolerans]